MDNERLKNRKELNVNFNDSHIPICNVNFINGINTSQVFYCPNCGKRLKVNQRQCECGQLLRWDIEGGKTMQLSDIVKFAAKVGAEAATAEAARKENQRQKELKDRRLYNTKLLLTNYREFKACSKEAIFKASQADELISVLDLMWDPNNRTDAVVESIKKSAIKTKIIMTHIDAMLSVYGEIVAVSHNDIDRRRYYIMKARYIDDEARSIQSLAKEYFIDERTVYFDLDIAIDKMSKLLFGIETIRND